MIEFLYTLDVAVFFLINHSLTNPVFDALLPFITDLNKSPWVLAALGGVILYVLWKGGRPGRVTIGLLIVTVIISDQLNSSILKEFFARVRPCRALEGVRLLVDCGGGLSFPSSHAVNNFGAATVISHFYRSQRVYWYTFAGLVAFSRPYVGVHYPSDIVAGALVGFLIGLTMVYLWKIVDTKIRKLHNTGSAISL